MNFSCLMSSQNDTESFILAKPSIPTKNLEIRIKKVFHINTMKNLVESLFLKLTIMHTCMVPRHDMFNSHDRIHNPRYN